MPALMDPINDALNKVIEPIKKFDCNVVRSTDGKAAEIDAAANTTTVGDGPNQTGPKPPDYELDWFHENLQKGIPIECGKRSVFGFGLSSNQEDALYQYISNKSSKRPLGHEPNRTVLADCWGSPEPERDSNHSDSDNVPVVFDANLSQALPATEPTSMSSSVINPLEEKKVEEELDEVDVASIESLYEGEGGLDLESRSARAVDVRDNVDEGASARNVKQGDDGEGNGATWSEDTQELSDRMLIMQKVKECYGIGVKTSLERVMCKQLDGLQSILFTKGLQNPSTFNEEKSIDKIESNIIKEDNSLISPTTSKAVNDASLSNLWEDECMQYLERAPEFRARLHYEVRVILISPAFHIAGRTLTAFSRLYEQKFGRTIESIGFSTAARLCRSMPHVVQRALLIDEGKLQLVDTPKNHRIVAGIRSGLRRIVYGVIKNHQGTDIEEAEVILNKVIDQPLNEVLIDHGYQNPTIECLFRDILDIIYLDERAECTRVYLCNGAEDPALTDGLLIQGSSSEECFESTSKDKSKFNTSGSIFYSKLLEGKKAQSLNDDVGEQMIKRTESQRSGANGMAPEELSDLRVLCAAESSSPYFDISIYTIEDVSPHVRLRFRLFLALHNNGRGIKVEDVSTAYEKMFATPFDLSALGFDSFQELIDAWKDVILVNASYDGWIFPINTLENNRVLNTITSGLRSALFTILLARYPEGLEPLELVECLEETLSGKLWEILRSNGYIFKNINKTGEALLKGPLDFQLVECPELRLLLKDMEDFVRLGCREDGVLVVKLRDGEFPLLDLLDCEVSEEPLEGKDVQSCGPFNTYAFATKLASDHEDLLLNQATEVSHDVIIPNLASGSLTFEHDLEAKNIKNEKLTPLITMSFKKENIASPLTSPLSITNTHVDTSKQVCYLSQKLIHETRMILGSSEHMENGLTIEEFCTIYRERTGQPLHLGEFKSMESLLYAMPDIINFELDSISNEQMITLVQSRRNMRILSVAKVGLRQVLFWILLKNPGGVWKELLEGWYLDFAGWPLSSVLASHGYDKPRCAPLEPVTEFLQDMADLLTIDDSDSNLYNWIGLYKDPIVADASLLGVSVETIQYDSINEESENSRWQTSIIAKAALQLENKEFEKLCDIKTTIIPIDITTERH